MRVLVTGGRSLVALELVRNLGRHGHSVYLAESVRFPISRFSRYAQATLRTPSPRFNEAAYGAALKDIISKYDIEVLIPTCEEALYISSLKTELERDCAGLIVMTDSRSTTTQLHNKFTFYELLRSLKLPTPTTVLITALDDLAYARALVGPKSVIVKPAFSRFGTRRYVLTSQAPAPQLDFEARAWICQEYLSGSLLCSYSYAYRGRVVATSIYSQPGRPTGLLTRFRPTTNATVDRVIQKIVSHYGYSGNISLDFICNDSGTYVLECNPRLTSGIHCLARTDLGSIYFSRTDQPPFRDDRQILFANLASKRLFEGSFWRSLRRSKDVVWARDDLLPGVLWLVSVMEFVIMSVRHEITFTEATTYDIEWNGDDSL